jgi:DNA (cytosine-5)-methyltransferase 1
MSSRSSKALRCLDLFCGAGGLSTGMHMAGFETVTGIDLDELAIDTFNKNKLGKGIVADIEKISSEEVKRICGGTVDLIVGGPPCQGMSLSGSRNETDKRNHLYKSFVRIVTDLSPQAILLENVPGLVSLFDGKIRDAILADFTSIGYRMQYKILRASDYGVPQHRRRVVFIGFKDKDFDYPEVTHFENPHKKSEKPMVSCKDALSDLPPLPETSFLGANTQEYVMQATNEFQKLMRLHSGAVLNHIAAKHSDKVRSIIALVSPGKNYNSLPLELKGTRKFHVAWTRFPEDTPSPTIDTGHRHHFHYHECRVPTVRECARLQSFPDDFQFYGNKTQQFRQVGNAVPPLMAKALGIAIRRAFDE